MTAPATEPILQDEPGLTVLGSIILDSVLAPRVAAMVEPGDFLLPPHRELFVLLRDMIGAGVPIDAATVRDRASANGLLARLGGAVALHEMLAAVPTTANAEHYAEALRVRSQRRRLQELALSITLDASNTERTAEQIVAEAGERLRDIAARGGGGRRDHSILDALNEALRLMDDPHAYTRIPTGLIDYDAQHAGVPAIGLTYVGARTGVGKTAFCAQLAWRAASVERLRVRYYSMERTRDDMALVVVSQLSGVPLGRMVPGVVRTDDEMQRVLMAGSRIQDVGKRFTIADDSRVSPLTIRSDLARMTDEERPQLVVVDYIGLMDASSVMTRQTTREQAISWLSRELKIISQEFRCAFVVAAQLNRDVTRRGAHALPQLSDLRDSGSLEQDADVVILLHRAGVGTSDPSEIAAADPAAYVIAAKDRRGPVGPIEVYFDGPSQTFRNAARRF